MNANELADELDDIPVNDFESLDQHHYTRQAATMLRQQQAEIGFYKQDADRYKLKCASQQAEIEALKEQVAFLKEKCVMVDHEPTEHQFTYKYLFGDDLLAAQKKINDMLRQMVDELPNKDKP